MELYDSNSLGLPIEVLQRIFKFYRLARREPSPYVHLRGTCKLWKWIISKSQWLHNVVCDPHRDGLATMLPANDESPLFFLFHRWSQGDLELPQILTILGCLSLLNLEGPGACSLLGEVELGNLRMTQLSLHNDINEFFPTTPSSVLSPDTVATQVSVDAPQLRSLSLQGYHPPVISPLFSTALVRLELVCVKRDDSLDKYELNPLLDKLSQMPSLRELVLRRVLFEPPEGLPSNCITCKFDHLEKLVMEAQRPSGMPIYQLLSNSLQRRGVERHVERYFIVRAKDIKASELPPIVDIDEHSTLDIIVVSISMMRLQFHGKAPTNDQPRVSEVILRPAESVPLPTLFSRLESTMTQVKKLRIVEQKRPRDSPAEVPDMDLSTIDWRRALLRIPVTHLSVSTITHSNLEAFVRSIDVPAPASTRAIERPRQPLPELTEFDILKECWSVNDRKKVILPFQHRDEVSIFVDGETLYSNKPGILGRQDTLMVLDEE